MSTLEDIISSPENLEVKRALVVKMFLFNFKTEDICMLLDVSDSFVSKWKGRNQSSAPLGQATRRSVARLGWTGQLA